MNPDDPKGGTLFDCVGRDRHLGGTPHARVLVDEPACRCGEHRRAAGRGPIARRPGRRPRRAPCVARRGRRPRPHRLTDRRPSRPTARARGLRDGLRSVERARALLGGGPTAPTLGRPRGRDRAAGGIARAVHGRAPRGPSPHGGRGGAVPRRSRPRGRPGADGGTRGALGALRPRTDRATVLRDQDAQGRIQPGVRLLLRGHEAPPRARPAPLPTAPDRRAGRTVHVGCPRGAGAAHPGGARRRSCGRGDPVGGVPFRGRPARLGHLPGGPRRRGIGRARDVRPPGPDPRLRSADGRRLRPSSPYATDAIRCSTGASGSGSCPTMSSWTPRPTDSSC